MIPQLKLTSGRALMELLKSDECTEEKIYQMRMRDIQDKLLQRAKGMLTVLARALDSLFGVKFYLSLSIFFIISIYDLINIDHIHMLKYSV
jgi:hypothetical protein